MRFARAPQKRLVTEATERVTKNESVLFLLHIQQLVHKCFSGVFSIMQISNKIVGKNVDGNKRMKKAKILYTVMVIWLQRIGYSGNRGVRYSRYSCRIVAKKWHITESNADDLKKCKKILPLVITLIVPILFG